MERERIKWIDIAKGIGILLVIAGHTLNNFPRGFIFSFHMPLFFLLSAAAFTPSQNKDEFVSKAGKSFRRLVVPAIVITVACFVLNFILNYKSLVLKDYIIGCIGSLIFSSGVPVNFLGFNFQRIGIPWFLIVLFSGRTLFDYLHLKLKGKKLVIVICLCAIAGVVIGQIQWLPFSFDITLAILPFLYAGYFTKRVDMHKTPIFYGILAMIFWLLSLNWCFLFGYTYLELTTRVYVIFPVCYITAICGSLFVSYIGVVTERFMVMRPLIYLGKNSMYLLWVHCFDEYFISLWNYPGNLYISMVIRIVLDIAIFAALMGALHLIKKLKKQ